MSIEQVKALTENWIEQWVIGQGLCPFAGKPWRENLLTIEISESTDKEAAYQDFLQLLLAMAETPRDKIETALLVFAKATKVFSDYLDLLAQCEAAIEQAGLSGEFQLASFHPDYLFGGEDSDVVTHYTNRSPYPMMHLIREDSISEVEKIFPSLEMIPERNKAHLEQLGKKQVVKLLNDLSDV